MNDQPPLEEVEFGMKESPKDYFDDGDTVDNVIGTDEETKDEEVEFSTLNIGDK